MGIEAAAIAILSRSLHIGRRVLDRPATVAVGLGVRLLAGLAARPSRP
ncbi:MAG: hypothetical protein R3F59_37550 [Myxococcota bacterium]